MNLMRVVWLVGPDGGVTPPDELRWAPTSIAIIYASAPPEFRYAVGWQRRNLTVLDMWQTRITDKPPYIEPHFIEAFDDIDQAVAALTIRYEHGITLADAVPRRRLGIKWMEGVNNDTL